MPAEAAQKMPEANAIHALVAIDVDTSTDSDQQRAAIRVAIARNPVAIAHATTMNALEVGMRLS